MGYTHYFYKKDRSVDFTKSEIEEFVDIVSKIIEHSDVYIKGPNGEGEPILHKTYGVSFNGSADDEEDYETFEISNDKSGFSGFCKTARLPYNEVVVASIIAAKKVFGDKINVGSNAYDFRDVEDGIFLYERAMSPKKSKKDIKKYLKEIEIDYE